MIQHSITGALFNTFTQNILVNIFVDLMKSAMVYLFLTLIFPNLLFLTCSM